MASNRATGRHNLLGVIWIRKSAEGVLDTSGLVENIDLNQCGPSVRFKRKFFWMV